MKTRKYLLLILLLQLPFYLSGQSDTLVKSDTLTKKEIRKQKKALKIEQGKPLITPLAGPAYTPEMGFTIAGGVMLSYKTKRSDSLIQRSSSPIMFGVTSTGGYFFSTIVSTYWLQDKLRVYADIWLKNMPDNYFGVGYDNAFNTPKSDSTTAYNRMWWWFNPRILWQIKTHVFVGVNIDYNYTDASDPSAGVQEDLYYNEFGPVNLNSGLGVILRYDSRDVPVNAYKGMYIDFRSTFYSPSFGGDNNYQIYQLDFRKYFQIKRPGMTIAIQVKTRLGLGNVPYAEMSQLGTPFDLRGYRWGQYRDNSLIFFLGEYRHMFMKKSDEMSRHGVVGWLGTGSIGQDVSQFRNWLPNAGLGYRFQVQPRMNVRVDIGFGKESRGFYFNFNEAF